MSQGMIFDIQRFCLHDGPGIRTTVFFKGCPLRCPWCCNPESQHFQAELLYRVQKCLKCGRCIDACPQKALWAGEDGIVINRSLCAACGACAEVCPSEALQLCGNMRTAEEILQLLERDRAYYEMSGGGVTFSGGETTAQPAFLAQMLQMCQNSGLHTAIETCGACEPETFAALLPACSLIYFDWKLPDAQSYQKLLGAEHVRKNLIAAAETGRCIVRIPLIPGVNMENPRAFGEALRELPLQGVELLPYHRMGSGKYADLGRDYALEALLPPSAGEIAEFRKELQSWLKCSVTIRS